MLAFPKGRLDIYQADKHKPREGREQDISVFRHYRGMLPIFTTTIRRQQSRGTSTKPKRATVMGRSHGQSNSTPQLRKDAVKAIAVDLGGVLFAEDDTLQTRGHPKAEGIVVAPGR